MEINIIFQQLLNGLTLGSIYGLIAIGYTMVYGIIGMINFAHGDVYMVSSYLTAICIALFTVAGIGFLPALLLLTLVCTVFVTAFFGFALDKVAYKPLRNSTQLAPLISAIGMSLVLQNYVQISQGARTQGIPTLVPGKIVFGGGDFPVSLTYIQLIILLASFVGMAILSFVIGKTKLGRRCRATQQDRKMAKLLGIDTDRTVSTVFVIGASMAGLAGMLVTMNYGSFDFAIGFVIGIKAFTAAVLGGIGSLPGGHVGRPRPGHVRIAVFGIHQHRLQGRFRVLSAGVRDDFQTHGIPRKAGGRKNLTFSLSRPQNFFKPDFASSTETSTRS